MFFFYAVKEKGSFSIKKAESSDGCIFKTVRGKINIKDRSNKKESIEKYKGIKTAKQGKKTFIFYKKRKNGLVKDFAASSGTLSSWTVQGPVSGVKDIGAIVPDFFYDKDRVMYTGGKSVKIAYSRNMLNWKKEDKILMKPRAGNFETEKMIPAQAFVRKEGIVLIYYAYDKHKKISLGISLFSKDDPERLLWRGPKPIWKQKTKGKIHPLGLAENKNRLFFYYEDENKTLVSVALPVVWNPKNDPTEEKPLMLKSARNPLFGPRPENSWENFAAFNPTAFQYKNKVYLLYRALGNDNISKVGCAISSDGINIDERFPEPIYSPTADFEAGQGGARPELVSGGGWGGCEDPKVTLIGNTLYMVYVAFNGWSEPNIALTSIPLKDFLEKNWEAWKKPVKITSSEINTKNPEAIKESLEDRPGQTHIGDKNPALLPSKVKGKYVIFHRLWPNIVYDYIKELDFDGKTFLRGNNIIPIRKDLWDGKKIGIGCAPIKIKEGWLAFYNAVSDGKYKIGAMILDHNDPSRILYRSSRPVIEPMNDYENNGHKFGVVFAGGSVIKEGKLFVYYGGSDKCACVAVADADEFIEKLKDESAPKMNKVKIKI